MIPLELLMPLLVLVLSFTLKLFIDRTTTAPDAVASTLELPVDISFFSTSLIVAFTIAPNADSHEGLAWFCTYIIASVIVVFVWRRSVRCFDQSQLRRVICLAAVNYVLAVAALVNSIHLVTEVAIGAK